VSCDQTGRVEAIIFFGQALFFPVLGIRGISEFLGKFQSREIDNNGRLRFGEMYPTEKPRFMDRNLIDSRKILVRGSE
jgi:hypothetical protein